MLLILKKVHICYWYFRFVVKRPIIEINCQKVF